MPIQDFEISWAIRLSTALTKSGKLCGQESVGREIDRLSPPRHAAWIRMAEQLVGAKPERVEDRQGQ